ncbi:cytochrome P450 [Streptomyces violascens]|uniref:cytochrome P450 n=1 Tax=Streptomyces violascens TaxID=67381 RepID=UPI003675E800
MSLPTTSPSTATPSAPATASSSPCPWSTATPPTTRRPTPWTPGRHPPRHLAFGGGPHQCLSQHLARTQLHTAFSSLLTRFPHLHLDGDPTAAGFQPGTVLQRMTALPVHW